jgi:hypothetical protein
MELVLDSYRGGDVKEIKVRSRLEYGKVVTLHLREHSDNFVTVRGKNKSYVIESNSDNLYDIYEANYNNRVSMPLIEAINYIYDNAQQKLI